MAFKLQSAALGNLLQTDALRPATMMASPFRHGLSRSIATLLAGGLVAQMLPLVLGPWLTRVYDPSAWGQYSLFTTWTVTLAVVACGRFEFALPLEAEPRKAREVFDLALVCLIALVAVLLVLTWLWRPFDAALWLAPAVASAGALSVMTLWATRQARFRSLAVARVIQYGGAAVLQIAFASWWPGWLGLVLGFVGAMVAAAFGLVLGGVPESAGQTRPAALLHAMRRHRDFPLLNAPHAMLGALADALAVMLLIAWYGEAAAGVWTLTLRYTKAPSALVGSAVGQVLYPRLCAGATADNKRLLKEVMVGLGAMGVVLGLGLFLIAPILFGWMFGSGWQQSGELARALSPYIAAHFVASPLGVVTMAWGAQAWALRLAVVGQCLFLGALLAGMAWGGMVGAGWAISAVMVAYFVWYFRALVAWEV